MDKNGIRSKLDALLAIYRSGGLGGEVMPEDENPGLEPSCMENYMYFSLPMALNYQRNSYTLWACANRMYAAHPEVFNTGAVCEMSDDTLRQILVEHKVALQPNKQPVIWKTLCRTIECEMEGDLRKLFAVNENSVRKIKAYIAANRKKFPYLAGNKICNYWLYVLEQYTDARFEDRENITIAPDTHVIQASVRLGIISEQEARSGNVQEITASRWNELLTTTNLTPIDVHTPLWLWSRGKFAVDL